MATRDWRQKADYAEIENFTPRELAWEYLRRNPDFKRDQRRVKKKAESAAAGVIAQFFFFIFRGRPFSTCERSGGVLVALPRQRRRRANDCAPELHAPAA